MFLVPAMVIFLNIEIRLACAMVRALNATSQAIGIISQELGQVRELILEN